MTEGRLVEGELFVTEGRLMEGELSMTGDTGRLVWIGIGAAGGTKEKCSARVKSRGVESGSDSG